MRKAPKLASRDHADLLRKAGLRCTPARVGLLEILSRDHQPLSAAQLLDRLPARIDKVTLYRTLHTLTRKKLLHRVRGDDQIWRYGTVGPGSAAHQEHAHFVCDECGAVECLAGNPIRETPAKHSNVRRGYRVKYSEVLVHGSCPNCQH